MAESRPENALRVLLYSVNGTGLGHVTRLLAIARWLRTLLNGLDLQARIFFLSCSDADSLIGGQGFPSFKLPSKTALRRAMLSDAEAIELIRGFAGAAIDWLRPDVLVVDTFPAGSYDELLPALGREEITKVFVFRQQRADYAASMPYEMLLHTFHLVLMPHPEEQFELPFKVPPGVRTAWAGNVIFGERHELWSKSKVRSSLGIDRGKTVVYAAAGGGGDPHSEKTLKTISKAVQSIPDVHLVVGAGPLYRQPGAGGRDTTWTTFYPISRLFRGFDFAVSSSGYNTVHELLHFGLPAVLYAQVRGADDQLARARRVARGGAAVALESLTPANLKRALQSMSDPERREAMRRKAEAMVPRNGARRAAEAILETALPRRYPEIPIETLSDSTGVATGG